MTYLGECARLLNFTRLSVLVRRSEAGKIRLSPITSVDQLQARLASAVILFMAIAYVKVLVDRQNPVDTLLFGAATGILIAVLIQYYKAKAEHGE